MKLLYKSTEISVADLGLYWKGTTLKVHEKDQPPRWLQFQKANGDFIYFIDSTGTEIVIPRSNKLFLEQFFPVGFFNLENTTVFGARIPIRSVTKGISLQNYVLHTAENLSYSHFKKSLDSKLENYLSMLSKYTKFPLSAKVFELMEKTPYSTLSQAYVAIKSKKAFARALSPEYALFPHPFNKDFLIFRNNYPIAELVSKNKVKMLFDFFKPDCEEFFKSLGATIV